MKISYHLFLPKTSFAMKGQMPLNEPKRLLRWQARKAAAYATTKKPFIVHDGPPYANGYLHMGHALNKILKDMINRSKAVDGFAVPFIPGWDCHGLPIEWQVEQELTQKGIDKKDMSILAFRSACRRHAEHWQAIQKTAFQRLGVAALWDSCYDTMAQHNEAAIFRELSCFLLDGSLYRGVRPVMWSYAEQTALADAEVDYKEHHSTTVFVRFPVVESPQADLRDASIVIWTTTPWTLPSNRAIAYGTDIDYTLLRVTSVSDGSLARIGEKLVLASARLEAITSHAGITAYEPLCHYRGDAFTDTIASHPFAARGYDIAVPLLAADFVDTETGSGFVHIAPGHGEDDFRLGIKHHLEVTEFVQADGCFVPELPLFGGLHVFKANTAVIEALRSCGALLLQGRLRHSYPHSWRSNVPLIFRVTPQWFISMDHTQLRSKALRAIASVAWHPESARSRIEAMITERPDWCVSRQRLWGVPLSVFLHKKTHQVLRDKNVCSRIIAAMQQEGADAWFAKDPCQRFLPPDYDPQEWIAVQDILDVWFDSGSSHAYVLQADKRLSWPADLYVEGSDQHRGWFQSSLLESCGTKGNAPYKQVLTHGFVLDAHGYKMSKSRGNVLSPQDVIDRFGADVLRLWVASSDSSRDLRLGDSVLRSHVDGYRRLRHCLRFLLGALNVGGRTRLADHSSLPELERFILHRLIELERLRTNTLNSYRFSVFYSHLQTFCTNDLSAFYFDIRKDCLYCDSVDSPRRLACLAVMESIFLSLLRWLFPVLCFTCDEAWEVHCEQSAIPYRFLHDVFAVEGLPPASADWADEALATKWHDIRRIRRVITSALERQRETGTLRSSLDAHVDLYLASPINVDWAEVAIVSSCQQHKGLTTATTPLHQIDGIDDVGVAVTHHTGVKCPRCWQHHDTNKAESLCQRCQQAEISHQKHAVP